MYLFYYLLISFFLLISVHLPAQNLPSIASKIAGAQKNEGFMTYYWDEANGKIWLEINRFEQDILYVHSLPAGLGSNDIGLDRGQLGQEHVVHFKKIGNKVLLVKPNLRFRALTENPNEKRAVEESFAQSVLWGFQVEAQTGQNILVDATDFLLSDVHEVVKKLKEQKQGTYQLDKSRSAIYLPRTKNFPKNSEFESILTFTGGDDAGNYVESVASTVGALALRTHHSFVELPDLKYKPRVYDARSGFFDLSYYDYATPVQEYIHKRVLVRHRLEKKNPELAISEALEPIIYYVDNGCPEPIRSALLEGASWWNQAFEAAGFKDAFQVKVLPDGADPMDTRYNMIQWVHRSTRGWSYGSTVTDPRTGEIIKGHVTLGSLRIRQDYLIAEGLLAPYEEGKEISEEMMKMSLARIRQLAAHEVGHTLGLAHNYASSYNNRASVMDYPHPLVKLDGNGNIDLSEAYATGIGEWDKVAINFGYRVFDAGANESKELETILMEAIKKGLLYISDRDARAAGGMHPYAHLWDNGNNAAEELDRLLKVRGKALSRFSSNNLRTHTPMSMLEDVLVPVYHFHRYQLEATSKIVGGLNYTYTYKNDGQLITKIVPKAEQQKALESVLNCLSPDVLAIPENIIAMIPPKAMGYDATREHFEKRTGLSLDPLMAAEALASYSLSFLMHPQRANRMIEYKARENNLGWDDLLSTLIDKTWKQSRESGLKKEIQFGTEQVILSYLLSFSMDEGASWQAKAICNKKIQELKTWIEGELKKQTDESYLAHLDYSLKRIQNPSNAKISNHKQIPAGAPIGCEEE